MTSKAWISSSGLKFPIPVPLLGFEVVGQFPHDKNAFTEGLELFEGSLFESTGLRGFSTLRRVELKTGLVQQKVSLDKPYFGEGLTILDGKVFQLTYQEGVCFVYDLKTFNKLDEFSFKGQGWGLTHDSKNLIMSDATNQLQVRNPATFEKIGTIAVEANGKPVNSLNELEYVDGTIYANVLPRSFILRIDANTGNVTGQIDLRRLKQRNNGVLNGIAQDEKTGHFFVTGKNWDSLFEIRLTGKSVPTNARRLFSIDKASTASDKKEAEMAKDKDEKRPSAKKSSKRKKRLGPFEQDPPIIVGGGGSTAKARVPSIRVLVRRDLNFRAAGTVGLYKVFECRNVAALGLEVFEDASSTGTSFLLDPDSHETVYYDPLSLAKRGLFKRSRKRR